MGIFQKLKKLGVFHLTPPENHRRGRRDEGIPREIHYGPLPRSFLSAVDLARAEDGFEPLPRNHRRPARRREEHLMDRNPMPEFGALDRNRKGSHERRFDRRGSPENFHHQLPGTPIKYRRRPISPELLQPRASSPFGFGRHSLPSSPDMIHRFSHVQQQQQQQPQQQFDMAMPPHSAQFHPQFQQQFYPMMHPNVNMHPWFMIPQQQQQQQMYPFY